MSSGAPRIRSLDGLRGAAAVAVLLHHISLVARPELSASTWAWLTQSPLKLLFAGSESVLIFFVLSGLVVALPAMREGFSWLKYYPARMLRLYLPVCAALLLSAALIVLLPRDRSEMPADSWMSDAQATSITPMSLLSEASLTRRTYDIDNVLWSLRWEVVFSLLLPLFVWIALRTIKHPVALAALCLVATVLGRVIDVDVLVYIPLFLLGAVLASHLGAIERYHSKSQWLLPALAVLAGLLLIASWLVRPLDAPQLVRNLLWGLAGAGAALTVALAVMWPGLRWGLEMRPAQWLGRISFSLYLVHVPIIATLVYLFGSSRWWLAALLAVPISLGVAALFQWGVEAPAHRLSRAVGARVRRMQPA